VASRISQAAEWLRAKRKAYLATRVTYHRGEASVALDVSLGKSVFETDDGRGATIVVERRDFIIPVADLTLGGERVRPKAGDRIRETVEDVVHVYEVMGVGKEPPAVYGDQWQRTWRVHTAQVDTEGGRD
jgi:hypothetical protein